MTHSEELDQSTFSKTSQETKIPLWKKVSATKGQARDDKIPTAWRLPEQVKNSAATAKNLLHIPETCGILSTNEIAITSKNDAVDIVEAIRSGKYSAEAVVTAFCKRGAIAQQLVSSLIKTPIKLMTCFPGELLDRGFL